MSVSAVRDRLDTGRWDRHFDPSAAAYPDSTEGPVSGDGAGHLSCDQAAGLFKDHRGWTLHQLRHSSLTNLVAMVTNSAQLQAKGRHRNRSVPETYTTLGDAAVGQITSCFNDRPGRWRV